MFSQVFVILSPEGGGGRCCDQVPGAGGGGVTRSRGGGGCCDQVPGSFLPVTWSQHLPPPRTWSQHLPPSPRTWSQHLPPGPGHNTSPPPGPGHNTSLPPGTWSQYLPPPPWDYAQVGGTHPTGMHSCYLILTVSFRRFPMKMAYPFRTQECVPVECVPTPP